MTLKRTELAKNKMIKITHAVRIAGVPDRFGAGSDLVDRKEQRRLDQAAGLIPFACKLPSTLVQALHACVAAEQSTMNDWVAGLLAASLGVPIKKSAAESPATATPAIKQPTAAAPPAVKVPAAKPAAALEKTTKVTKAEKIAVVAKVTKVAKVSKKTK